ncbi:helix-turn-helix domain-containing protein [Halorarum halophilum]|uniref:Helix-turn-helix domain-containing protein n=1 Tax=Halorarum halophilum TaxID=2743090 RepID=A0A7D5GCH5_9EURY|nr:helix-turn-helix domain-containing protein [Halobaculum halophilum]QLG28205.1 helix-turn-helix domain-containing protein [Halobaculum halophilum]
MSVILEFTIDSDEFALGTALGGIPGMVIELERLVPMGGSSIPFFWASGGDFDALETQVRESDLVTGLTALDRIDDMVHYRVDWVGETGVLLKGIHDMGGAILEGTSNGTWHFRVRFPDHQALAAFYNYLTEHDVSVHVERVYTLTEETSRVRAFDLTHDQREALVLALDRGYFATPSEASLDDLAEDLGITQQALSKRIRRGNEKVLRNVLGSSANDLL